ncbi:MAG: MFS transporter [Acidimicrobiales bacterium]|nr:MAG: MFS transporter [Acidimicrobiales bacterium]
MDTMIDDSTQGSSPTAPPTVPVKRLRGARRFGRKAVKACRRGWERVIKARNADGAGQTGMHRLIDLHAASVAGDAAIAVALAGTIFFNVPVGEARLQVGLYLLITMAPFALLAPAVGPILDRFRHGRRYALATTMLARAFLAWLIASQLHSWILYPAAFGVLVLSRAYGVARSAAVPRLLPERLTLVEANARGSLAGMIAGAIAGGAAVLLAHFGVEWALRGAAVVFVVGMISALRLPPRADSQRPEALPRMLQFPGHKTSVRLFSTEIWTALVATSALRALYGFLTLYFAFRTREDNLGPPAAVALGAVVGALGLGSLVATVVGTRLKLRHPLRLHVAAALAATLACAGAAATYSLPAAIGLAFITALSSGLCKLGVDAVIAQGADEGYRASAFGRSETLLQLAWVFGGAVGLIPLAGHWGLSLAAICVGAAAVAALRLWTVAQRTPEL